MRICFDEIISLGVRSCKILFIISIISFLTASANGSILNNIPQAMNKNSANFLLKTFKEKPNMNLSCDFLQHLKELFNIKTFIETGTYLGYTTEVASKIFEKVFTVELSRNLFNQVSSKFGIYTNVEFYCDESPIFLKKVLLHTKDFGKILFWLDAHYSGGKTVCGAEKTPIIKELDAIKQSQTSDGIIMIDDIRYFYKDGSDYPSLASVMKQLLSINPTYQIITLGDILLAYPEEYHITVSPVIRASTLSRLYYQDESLPIDINYEEEIISKAEGEEREALTWLQMFLSRSEHLGINNRAYTKWAGLISNQ